MNIGEAAANKGYGFRVVVSDVRSKYFECEGSIVNVNKGWVEIESSAFVDVGDFKGRVSFRASQVDFKISKDFRTAAIKRIKAIE